MRWARYIRQAVLDGRLTIGAIPYVLASERESIGEFELHVDTEGVAVRRAIMSAPGTAGLDAWSEDRVSVYLRVLRGSYNQVDRPQVEARAASLVEQLEDLGVPVTAFSWTWERDIAGHDPTGSPDAGIARVTLELAE